MFANFAKSLEGRFSSIDECFSQVLSGSSSKVHDSRDNVIHQDLLNRSFTAPSPVAMRSEHSPDRALSASYTGDLGTTLGGPATASALLGDTSLPCMSFTNLTTVRFFESSGGRVPDRALDLLLACIVCCSGSVPGRG